MRSRIRRFICLSTMYKLNYWYHQSHNLSIAKLFKTKHHVRTTKEIYESELL